MSDAHCRKHAAIGSKKEEIKRRHRLSSVHTPSTSPGSSRHSSPRHASSEQTTPTLQPQAAPVDPASLSAGDVVKSHGTPLCPATLPLVEAAKLLLSSDRTAAAVLDCEGEVRGVLSEADLLSAYLDGAPLSQPVAEWMERKGARVPAEVAKLAPETSLPEAAALMLQAAALCGGARQHLLVENTAGIYFGILSALDLTRAVCASAASEFQDTDGDLPVSRVMRSRGVLPVCSLRCTIRQMLRTLINSRQGAVLVADSHGVHGIVTPRDAVRAFARRVSPDEDVRAHAAGLLGILQVRFERRIISADSPAWHAAAAMAHQGVHHLVVVRPGGSEIIGALSALDLARCYAGPSAALLAPPSHHTGPLLVGDAVDTRVSPECPEESSLLDACDDLIGASRSAAVVMRQDGAAAGLITENDLLRAYIGQVDWTTEVGEWLRGGSARCPSPVLNSLVVGRDMPLTEAAVQMARQALSNHACHHLLVEGFGPPAVLSSLDIARTLCEFGAEQSSTETEVPVREATKFKDFLPMVSPTCSLSMAFDILHTSHQNCVLVVEEDGSVSGLITPRDVLRAFAEHLPGTSSVGGWLHGIGSTLELRVITADARLADAAEAMAAGSLHHLLVVEPGKADVVGVVSSLDIVCALASGRHVRPEVTSTPRNWHVVDVLMPLHPL